MSKTRRNHGSAFKAKVALEALKGEQTVAEIASKLHPTLVNEWKRQLADGASSRKGAARLRRTARRWSASLTSKSASRKWNWIFFKNGKTGCLLRLSGGVEREAGDVTVLVPSEAGGRANPGSAPVCLSGMRPGDADPLQQPSSHRVAAGSGSGAPEDPAL